MPRSRPVRLSRAAFPNRAFPSRCFALPAPLFLAVWISTTLAFCPALADPPAAPPEVKADAPIPPELDRATRLLVRGDIDGAIGEYQALLARVPADPLAPMACMATANLYLEAKGDTSAALEWCARVVRDYPDSPWAPVAAGRQAQQSAARGDWAGAGDAWYAALRLAPADLASRTRRAELAGSMADCYEKAGDPARLTAACRQILAGAPTPELAATALWRLGLAHETAGAADSAAACYARVIRAYPSSPEFSKAMEKRALIEPQAPLDWAPYEIFLRGGAYLAKYDYAAGLANAESLLAMTKDPALVECGEYRKLTCETWVSGDLIAGAAGLRAFLARYPEGLRAATARQTLNDRWQPLADMQQGGLDAPDDAQAQQGLGDTFVRFRLYKTGMEALEKAAALAPDDPGVLFSLGHGYVVSGRVEEAKKAFTRCLELNPEDTQTLNLIGYAFLGTGQAAEALPYFERYVALAPDDANSHDSYGEGLLAAGRAADSAREYEKALQLRPGFDNSAFMLGRAYREMGNAKKAIEAFHNFLELQPNGDRAAEARTAISEIEKETKP